MEGLLQSLEIISSFLYILFTSVVRHFVKIHSIMGEKEMFQKASVQKSNMKTNGVITRAEEEKNRKTN